MKELHKNNNILEESEEINYIFQTFNAEKAYKIGSYIAEKAINEGYRLSVEIVVNNKLLFHFSTDTSTSDTNRWIKRKLNTVYHFQTSTKSLLKKNKGNEDILYSKYRLDLKEVTLTPGGFPIHVKGIGVIGAIAVSGLEPLQDHEMILEAIKQHL
ncbi:MAG: heme-binding protein [Erysipelotrichaceae bacterium]